MKWEPAVISMGFVGAAIGFARSAKHVPSPAEWVMIALLFLFVLWLLNAKREPRSGKPLDQSIAFRLGKALKRIVRRESRLTLPTGRDDPA